MTSPTLLGAGLALAASAGYGLGDVVASAAVRRHTASSVALWVQCTSLVFLAVAALVVRPQASVSAVAWAGLGGALVAVGVLAYYSALQNGATSVVTVVGGTGVLIPLTVGLVLGDDPRPWVVVGVVVLVVGVLVLAFGQGGSGQVGNPHGVIGTPARGTPPPTPDGCRARARTFARPHRAALLLSVLAAVSFGLFYLAVDRSTTAASAGGTEQLGNAVLVALTVQGGALAVTVVAASRHSLVCVRPRATLVPAAAAIGGLDALADVALTYAIGIGPLYVIGPLASLDPLIAVLLVAVVFRERVKPLQWVGMAMALAGIVLVST